MKIDKEEIFCAVTAYNEKFLDRMIEDAYCKASDPSRVYFGIYNQKSDSNNFEDFSEYKNVKSINLEYDDPLGVSYGRLSASMLHEGQEYFSQMDGHLLFYKNWDKTLVDNYKLLKKFVQKPILSQSVVCHEVSSYNDYSYQESLIDGDKVYPLVLDERGDTSPDMSRENEERFLGRFLEHGLMFACAEFMTSSEYIYEVSYDPFIMYLPEQEISALRAATRGYRFFSSGVSTMSHLGKSESFSREKFSDDFFWRYNSNQKRSEDYYRSFYEQSAYAALLGKRIGFYGSPSEQDYLDYMSRIGVPYSDTHRDVYDNIEEAYSKEDLKGEEIFFRSIF
jgi:hypothetical protein